MRRCRRAYPLHSQDVLESRRWGHHGGLLYERRCRCRCRVADGPPRSARLRCRLEILIKRARGESEERKKERVADDSCVCLAPRASVTVQTCIHARTACILYILALLRTNLQYESIRQRRYARRWWSDRKTQAEPSGLQLSHCRTFASAWCACVFACNQDSIKLSSADLASIPMQ